LRGTGPEADRRDFGIEEMVLKGAVVEKQLEWRGEHLIFYTGANNQIPAPRDTEHSIRGESRNVRSNSGKSSEQRSGTIRKVAENKRTRSNSGGHSRGKRSDETLAGGPWERIKDRYLDRQRG